MIINFKGKDNLNYTLQVKKGNNKPIDKDIWIINISSAYYCTNKTCNYHRLNKCICYALLNELQFNNTIVRAVKDSYSFNYLVKNNMWEFLANKIINHNEKAKKHHIKHLRINERGELSNIEQLVFINELANILYNQIGVSTTIYTHREDLYKAFKANYKQSKGLIIIGSEFEGDIKFSASNTLNPNYNYNCYSNCLECKQKHLTPLCYDLKLKNKGITIKEKLRDNNNKKVNTTLKPHIIKQLTEINNYYKGGV